MYYHGWYWLATLYSWKREESRQGSLKWVMAAKNFCMHRWDKNGHFQSQLGCRNRNCFSLQIYKILSPINPKMKYRTSFDSFGYPLGILIWHACKRNLVCNTMWWRAHPFGTGPYILITLRLPIHTTSEIHCFVPLFKDWFPSQPQPHFK